MGDLADEDGKDENRAIAQPGCEEFAKLHVGAGHELQTPMLVFKLVNGSFLLFLFCYMNWVLLIVMAILVCCVIILKLAYHYHEQHDAGHPVDHNAQPIPQIPRQDHEQENVDQHKAEHNTQHTPEIPKQEHENEKEKPDQHKIEEPEQEKYERGQQIHEIEDHLQAGNHLDKRRRKEHKKKKNRKMDSTAEQILEGVFDATTTMVDISTGGIFSSFFSIFGL